jgi:uncharacterized protein YbjT (DUF2867 family)
MSIVVTGATGALGSSVLKYLHKFNADSESPKTIIGTTRDLRNVSEDLTATGIELRYADFDDDSHILEEAFAGAEKVLLISTDVFDNEKRIVQHKNAVDAVKRAGVGRIYYTSFCSGGYENKSVSEVQQLHLETEEYIKRSGINFTIVREGIYADSFPVMLNWTPESTRVVVPDDGPVAWISRDELAEANARLLLNNERQYRNAVTLLTGPTTLTLRQIAELITEVTGKPLSFEVSEDAYVLAAIKAGQNEKIVKTFVTIYKALGAGEGDIVDPLAEELLGRKPIGAKEKIRELLEKGKATGGYRYGAK